MSDATRRAGELARSPGGRAATWAGLLTGAVAAGTVAERRASRRSRARRAALLIPGFGHVDGRGSTVTATDGVPLHVVEVGPADAALTIVLVHGYACAVDAWCYQVDALRDLGRLVLYDQRSHGRSGASDAGASTIDQLGDDLFRVLTERVPTGPVVLVGHSMGGMTIMALAAEHPELFGARVVGVALLSTTAGKVASVTFGLPASLAAAVRRTLPGVTLGVSRAPRLVERFRGGGSDIAYAFVRRISFGPGDVDPNAVDLVERMAEATPVPVLTAFLPTLLDHDKLAALPVLASVPTLILVGSADIVTPQDHARAMAEALPEADFVLVEGAGHMVILERPDEVDEALRTLVERATPRTARRRFRRRRQAAT